MCDCIKKVDALFKKKGIPATVSVILPLADGVDTRVMVSLERTGRGKVPVLATTYCPFCGEKYKGQNNSIN